MVQEKERVINELRRTVSKKNAEEEKFRDKVVIFGQMLQARIMLCAREGAEKNDSSSIMTNKCFNFRVPRANCLILL